MKSAMMSPSPAFHASTTAAAVRREGPPLRVGLEQDLGRRRRPDPGRDDPEVDRQDGGGLGGAREVAGELEHAGLDLGVDGNALARHDDVTDVLGVPQVAAHRGRHQPGRRRREAGVGVAFDRVLADAIDELDARVGRRRVRAAERQNPSGSGRRHGAHRRRIDREGLRDLRQLRGAGGRQQDCHGDRGATLHFFSSWSTGAGGGAPPNRNPEG